MGERGWSRVDELAELAGLNDEPPTVSRVCIQTKGVQHMDTSFRNLRQPVQREHGPSLGLQQVR